MYPGEARIPHLPASASDEGRWHGSLTCFCCRHNPPQEVQPFCTAIGIHLAAANAHPLVEQRRLSKHEGVQDTHHMPTHSEVPTAFHSSSLLPLLLPLLLLLLLLCC